MADVYLCVVSHDDDDLVRDNFLDLQGVYGVHRVKVIVIDNIGSSYLEDACKVASVQYFSDGLIRGYGANNNLGFSKLIGKQDDSVFVVCNPDVTIQTKSFGFLVDEFVQCNADILGVKVFESQDLSVVSSHSRKAPCLFDPLISMILGLKLYTLDADIMAEPDWIGGCFMMFKPKSFVKLKGFDERYFMYYEDTDICMRAKKLGMKIIYNPDFYIVHEAKRKGRRLFSKYFMWNFISMIRFFWRFPPRCLAGRNYGGK